MSSEKTAILGFGNPVRSDDAVGVYVATELQGILKHHDDISVFDMGTSAFEVLFKLKGHNRIIIVDAVINSGDEDGTLYAVPLDEIKTHLQNDPLVFLHGMKWDQALSYAKKLMGNEFPEDKIQVYLVAISEIRMELNLSEKVKTAADKLIQIILKSLQLPQTQLPREAIPGSKSFAANSDVYLEGSHICVKKTVAEKVFGNEDKVLSVFYARDNTFMVAPAGENVFNTIHKGSQQMLKLKNAVGDKSISIHEVLLDNEIDANNRNLEYEMEEALHILKVKL